jgi:choline dehydrogenase-like flavoprotein
MTRRDFLSASTGLAVTPVLGRRAGAAPLLREADIVVIGAGAAGIAAARRIMAANRKVIVVEATSQIGGRCQTDVATFDVPFDRGARWMHNPETNPMIKLARAAGLEIMPAPSGQKIRIGRRNARAGEIEELLAALVRASRAIDEASRRFDVSCGSVMPKDLGDWAGTAEFVFGANFAGKDLKDVSVVDKARAQDRNMAIACRQGLGTLIAKLSGTGAVVVVDPG